MDIGNVVKKCWDRIGLRKDWWEQDKKKNLWDPTGRHVMKQKCIESKFPTNEIDR